MRISSFCLKRQKKKTITASSLALIISGANKTSQNTKSEKCAFFWRKPQEELLRHLCSAKSLRLDEIHKRAGDMRNLVRAPLYNRRGRREAAKPTAFCCDIRSGAAATWEKDGPSAQALSVQANLAPDLPAQLLLPSLSAKRAADHLAIHIRQHEKSPKSRRLGARAASIIFT